MNIFFQEMKMTFRSRLSWLIGLFLVLILFMSMYPAFSNDASLFEDVLQKFPKAFVDALGLTAVDLGDVLGFYGFMYSYIVLIGSIFAMKIGMGTISEEIRLKAADFLVAKPISRFNIVLWKGFVALANVTIVVGLYSGLGYILCSSFSDGPINNSIFFGLTLSFYLVCLFFMAFGMMAGAFFKRVRSVLPPVMAMVFGFYAVRFLSTTFPEAHLNYFTPFAYFDVAKILSEKAMDTQYVALSLGLTVIFILMTFYKYMKKDMPSV